MNSTSEKYFFIFPSFMKGQVEIIGGDACFDDELEVQQAEPEAEIIPTPTWVEDVKVQRTIDIFTDFVGYADDPNSWETLVYSNACWRLGHGYNLDDVIEMYADDLSRLHAKGMM